jgi:hypothetical protein
MRPSIKPGPAKHQSRTQSNGSLIEIAQRVRLMELLAHKKPAMAA